MYKRLVSNLPYWILIFVLFASIVPVHADGLFQGSVDDGFFSFAQIREDEIHMFGPFATHSVIFGLPANWSLLDGAQLNLDMKVAINSLSAQGNVGIFSNYIGTLAVILNGQTISLLPISDDKTVTETVPIPLNALKSTRSDGRMSLVFQLSSGETCLLDQQLDLVILASSSFVIPHDVVVPDTNFINFPRPIYQDSIFPDSARIVVPDKPTAAELQSAITVAAGLQARTSSEMQLSLVTSSELNANKLSDSHIIFVGKPSNLPLFSELTLPLGLRNGEFAGISDEGVLEMVASPWSQDRVVLIVSGNTDVAVVKASQALSTGVIRPNQFSNLALIDQVQDVAMYPTVSTDQTLQDLGYDSLIFEGRGESRESFQFNIPVGFTVTSEAFIEISLNHTSLLDYNRSGLLVLLNDQPIGSVRFSDATANQADNSIRIAIPSSVVKSGTNVMDLVALLDPVDECSDPVLGGLYLSIWTDRTRLFLPLTTLPADLRSLSDLSAYPSPFNQSASLDTTAFVVQNDNPDSWRYALNIAAYLGENTDGPIMTPSVFYADDIPFEERSNYNFLVIGAPSKLPLIAELNEYLPAPFLDGGDMATEKDLQVIYKITSRTPVGYVEMLESPWNRNNIIYAVLGNLPQGISWAANALVVDDVREKLSGNFAAINDTQVLSTDTRLTTSFEFVPPPTVQPAGTVAPSTVASESKPSWILMAMMVTGILIGVVIIVVLFSGLVRRRSLGKKPNKDKNRPAE